jgi:hypothetical protein
VQVPVGVAFAKRSGIVTNGTSDQFEVLAWPYRGFHFNPT